MKSKLWPLTIFFILLAFGAVAQKKTTKKPPVKKSIVEKPVVEKKQPDVTQDEKKVRDIVAFLEFMLNTLGGSGTSTRDKEVLITESYSKIFRDSKVQIEDDLDEERNVITNKDVVAYLKDVNFFFDNVRFEFTIDNIKSSTMPNGQYFYKVTTGRNLKGTTSEHKPVNNTTPRFIEINYNPKDQDLKIVSIYTNEFDEKRALKSWWKELSYEWQSVFRKKLNLKDSVTLNDIKEISSLVEMDISNNTYIQNIEPLAQLLDLKSLNISGTNVNDLSPIRNLTEIEAINLSDSRIRDLSALKYSASLKKLNISDTDVSDISVVAKMPDLQTLEMRGTNVIDFAPIANLNKLQKLDVSETKIASLSPIENLEQLTELNISSTPVVDLTPLKALINLRALDMDSTLIRNINALSNLEKLTVLYANHTSISDLNALTKLSHLEKIYCDQSLIKRETADAFMAANPKTLVILDSKDLKVWWDALSPEWRKVFSKAVKISETPSKEELAKVSLLDSINVSNRDRIDNLEPLHTLQRLETIIANKTGIKDLSPLRGHKGITYLDISETEVSDISPLVHFKSLKILKADKSKIENMELLQLPSLTKFYADQTGFHDITAREFLEKNPKCLLVYKTSSLTRWWNNLPESWKGVFREQLGTDPGATRENLHKLVEQDELHVKDAPVSNLYALKEFVRLKELHFSGTAISNISMLDNFKSLKSLHATNSPIEQIDSLDQLSQLEDLDISNTPINDLYAVWKLKKLKKLNCAGTQLKRLDVLAKLESLEYLDCSNTNVNRLDALDYLPLKTLKCYNTKVSNRVIENYKASHPECNVVYYR